MIITKETRIMYKTVARNCNDEGVAEIVVEQLFPRFSEDEKQFLKNCNKETWTRVPKELADVLMYQNFIEYVKLI